MASSLGGSLFLALGPPPPPRTLSRPTTTPPYHRTVASPRQDGVKRQSRVRGGTRRGEEHKRTSSRAVGPTMPTVSTTTLDASQSLREWRREVVGMSPWLSSGARPYHLLARRRPSAIGPSVGPTPQGRCAGGCVACGVALWLPTRAFWPGRRPWGGRATDLGGEVQAYCLARRGLVNSGRVCVSPQGDDGTSKQSKGKHRQSTHTPLPSHRLCSRWRRTILLLLLLQWPASLAGKPVEIQQVNTQSLRWCRHTSSSGGYAAASRSSPGAAIVCWWRCRSVHCGAGRAEGCRAHRAQPIPARPRLNFGPTSKLCFTGRTPVVLSLLDPPRLLASCGPWPCILSEPPRRPPIATPPLPQPTSHTACCWVALYPTLYPLRGRCPPPPCHHHRACQA